MHQARWLTISGFLGVGFLAFACSGVSSIGGDDGEGGEAADTGGGGTAGTAGSQGGGMTGGQGGSAQGGSGGYEPCAGRACGTPCRICPPDSMDCTETTDDKYCDANGQCGSPYPMCANECTTAMDCPAIGAPCQLCADGSTACPTMTCDNGQCAGSFPSCPTTCTTSMDCPVVDLPCQMCPNGMVSCPAGECVMGQCSIGYPGCGGVDPCDGKACGDRCSPTAPDMGGVPIAAFFCDHQGKCNAELPMCPEPECTSDMDCPFVWDICLDCPGAAGSCGGDGWCRNGVCQYGCRTPECMTASDCNAEELCDICRGRSCGVGCADGACGVVCSDL